MNAPSTSTSAAPVWVRQRPELREATERVAQRGDGAVGVRTPRRVGGLCWGTERLGRVLSHHLRDRPMPDRGNWRLQNELGWHDGHWKLLRFLDGFGIEPTNNRAERALRGAVIARKVSAAPRLPAARMRSEHSRA